MFEWEEEFEPHILQRGWNYYEEGAVLQFTRTEDRIEAVAAGSEYYKVRIRYDGHQIREAYCSCPYAEKGYYCKHMAAVLYEAEDEGEDEEYPDPVLPLIEDKAAEPVPLEDLIRSADRGRLEELLLELVSRDWRTETVIRSRLEAAQGRADLEGLEDAVDSIFGAHGGREGYIDYHAAFAFCSDLTGFLEEACDSLIKEGRPLDAFDLSVYAVRELESTDIDDDGETMSIMQTCYDIWLSAARACSEGDKARMKGWILQHDSESFMTEALGDALREFLHYELSSREELEEVIGELDKLIEKSRDRDECEKIFCWHGGPYREAIDLRIRLMKRLGASEDEVDRFRRQYMNFRSVRGFYLEKARREGNTEEEVRLLKEGIEKAGLDDYWGHTYAERLIEIYQSRGEKEKEKTIRIQAFLAFSRSTMEDFRACRDLCSEEEWERVKYDLIRSRRKPDEQCRLLAEEKMLSELYALILGQKDRIPFFNTYGFLFADLHPEEILEEYRRYVTAQAEHARNRKNYGELVRYLKRMQAYPGGREMVRDLCRDWQGRYPGKKVMHEELRTFRKE